MGWLGLVVIPNSTHEDQCAVLGKAGKPSAAARFEALPDADNCAERFAFGPLLPIVQKQVGHRTLKATRIYLESSDESVAEAYESAKAA